MKADFPGSDTQPWYRQFWPWFLILLPASVVVASLYTMYLAAIGSDDLVVDDYYKVGLAINRQLEKKQLSAELGITASLSFKQGRVTVNVNGPVDTAELKLRLSHPLEADQDFSLLVTRTGPATYEAEMPAAIGPKWHWTLEQPVPDGWRLDGSVTDRDIVNVAID